MLFLPNILIAVGIAFLILAVANRVYLFNYIKMLELQSQLKKNQSDLESLSKKLSDVDKKIKEAPADTELKTEDTTFELLIKQLEQFQDETSLVINKYFKNDDNSIGFEIPLMDTPEVIKKSTNQRAFLRLNDIGAIGVKAKFEDNALKERFLNFIKFYENVAKELSRNDTDDVNSLMEVYQQVVSEQLSLQNVDEYRYDTLDYWKTQLNLAK